MRTGSAGPHDAPLGEAGNRRDLCLLRAVSRIPEIDFLLDHPSTFGKVLGLMGPYIYVAGSEVLVRYPSVDVSNDLHPFHTDGGPSLARVFPQPGAIVLTLKVQYFLTDVSAVNHGNMMVVPGSHLCPFPETTAGFDGIAPRSVQIEASPGDAIVFPWSLWHGAAPNISERPRISVVLRYAQLWMRPVDYDTMDTAVLDRLTPRRRRLLGDLGPDVRPGDHYRPATGEHLRLIFGDDWVDAEQSRRYLEWESFAHALYATDDPSSAPGGTRGSPETVGGER